jgi:hypothetical protein
MTISIFATNESESMPTKSLSSIQLLDLSRQQRNLLLMRPMFELEMRKNQYESPVSGARLFDGVDSNYLVLCLLDYLMEAVAVDSGRTTKEVIHHLAEIAFTIQPELQDEECVKVAEVVLDAISNRADKYKEFEYEFWDASRKTSGSYRFKLVEYVPDIADVFRFVPTREGYLVYLGMLDLAPEDAAELMEKMLQLLIERGRFSDAIEIAKKARTISIELSQKIRDTIVMARRSPSSVNWKGEIEPRLREARAHVHNRQNEDARMTESVQTSLNTAYEPHVRQSLIGLKSVLQGANKVRTRLLQDIMVAPEQFLDAQRSLFRVRTASNLPDLENRLLPLIMQMPLSEISSVADPIISAFLPARINRIFDLETAMRILLEKRDLGQAAEIDDGQIVSIEQLQTIFSEEERRLATDWLAEKLDLVSDTTSEFLLRSAIRDGLSEEICQCIALLLYQHFSDDAPTRAFDIHISDSRFCLTFASGTSLVLKRRHAERSIGQ